MTSSGSSIRDESSRNKGRERDGDWMEDDGESRSHKRSPVSGDYSDEEDCMYQCSDKDCMDEDDDDDIGGGDSDDQIYSDAEETEVVESAGPTTYVVLTEDEVLARQADDTAKIAEVLSIPPAFAAFLLRRYKWRPSNLQEDWFSDDRRVRDAAGLPADGGVPVATALSPSPVICAICFIWYRAGRTRSAGCSHYYCEDCWRGYIRAAVGDGPRCLSLKCPDPACSAAVVRDLVDAVADGEDKDRYARFALRSYVEENGRRIKWCPGPGCTRAVEFVGDADDATEVFCACRHGFCWICGEEAHRPVSCGTVRAWMAKNKSDSESANWVLANTKHCPKCRRSIEKSMGCNHITCPHPCNHHFCWICFKPAGIGEHYACPDTYLRPRQGATEDAAAAGKEEQTKRQAKASLDRYLFHYERWVGNLKSLHKVHQDMEGLERSELEEMAVAHGQSVKEMMFLTEAYELIAYGRRVLRWSHAYGYYLDPERDGKKRDLFDYLQGDANSSLERLHRCVELERKEVFWSEGEAADVKRRVKDYKKKTEELTKATRTFIGNLVKAFETDLSEVGTMNF
ncbi:putative E3 ubiquitin-protein ligase ARI5 [Dichanthelium oligosanthes]|uniref:RBR-type E3 ubiquitin transferase n=1 Tax=Dichanthelium oligosanthes TaxID=888268 RepID=A0A1E5VL40_9POAL|nr:putative E3 ubiquitin-protein ligase ARI5 [Dichanthelium oligosanthes]